MYVLCVAGARPKGKIYQLEFVQIRAGYWRWRFSGLYRGVHASEF